MAGLSGQGTTYNLPNFRGAIIPLSPNDTKLVTMIGTVGGMRSTNGATTFEWQTYDLRDGDQRARLEGADAPTATARVRANVFNTVQIIQEKVETSWTKQSAVNNFDGRNIGGGNPVTDEHNWQIKRVLEQMKRDMEYTVIHGRYQLPTDNITPRKTRGLLQAISTNVNADLAVNPTNGGRFTVTAANPGVFTTTGGAHGLVVGDQVQFTEGSGVLPQYVDSAGVTRFIEKGHTYFIAVQAAANTFQITDTRGSTTGLQVTDAGTDHATRLVRGCATLTADAVLDTMQLAYDNGGIMEEGTSVLIVNSAQKRVLTNLFILNSGGTSANYQEMSRSLGGVALDTIETDFGTLRVILDRFWPNGAIGVLSINEMAIMVNEGKYPFLVQRPLAETGSADKDQIYGEFGLAYGNERAHALITHLSV